MTCNDKIRSILSLKYEVLLCYEKDMAEIMAFYAQISAKFPQDFSVDTRYHNDSTAS